MDSGEGWCVVREGFNQEATIESGLEGVVGTGGPSGKAFQTEGTACAKGSMEGSAPV